MQSDKQQPWKINVHAKAKHFNFKFKATNIFPTWMFFPFSIEIKLPCSLLKVESKPQVPIPGKRKSLKSKFLRILGKFQPRPTTNKAIAAKNKAIPSSNLGHFPVNQPRDFAYEGPPLCVGSIIVGYLALLSQSISQKDQKGIILYSLVILLYLALIFKKFITRRTRIILVIFIVAMLSCKIVVYLC